MIIRIRVRLLPGNMQSHTNISAESIKTMYCPKCGKENKDDARFCYACVAPLAPSGSQKGNSPSQSSHVHTPGMVHSSGNTLISSAIVLVGAILLFISSFVPAYKVSFWGFSGSYNYFGMKSLLDELDASEDSAGFIILGMIFIVLAILLIILKLLHKRVAGIILSIIAVIVSVYILVSSNNAVADSYGLVNISLGSSIYLSLIGSIIAAFGNIIKL